MKLVVGHVCPSTSFTVKHANRLCWPLNVTTVDFSTTSVHEAVCLFYHETVIWGANWPVWPLKITTADFNTACVHEAKQSASLGPAKLRAAEFCGPKIGRVFCPGCNCNLFKLV